MLRKDLIYRNPLRVMGDRSDDILPEGGFGAVLARAGLGKTALLVQLALDSLLQNKHVLHISLDDPVKKVCLWYEEVFKNISIQYDVKQMNELWESILPGRLIMTFNVDSFSVPKLDERLTDLTEQNIIHPKMMLIDGLPFAETDRKTLEDLKALAKSHGMHVWFTVTTHRHEASDGNGMPHPLSDVEDLFEVAFQLQPDGKQIHVAALKGGMASAAPTLLLDPSTMLINETDDAQKSSNSK
ncbi:AAA family ATPase [Desulfobacterales bacterium HSG16]|nr:AAA family ATPase [Desulfobacterales bacterium HSG16]